jgi:tetratricopeptide (TPR) repeat protein
MGRRRRRHQMGNGGNGGNDHGDPLVTLSQTLLSDTLSPPYVPVRGDASVILAPVLELEGLEPWAEIRGPALALEEIGGEDEAVLVFDDPAQLVLAAPEPGLAAEPGAHAAPIFEVEGAADGMADEVTSESTEFAAAAVAAAEDDPPTPPAGATDEAAVMPADAPVAEAEAPAAPPEPPPDRTEILYGEARDAAVAGRTEEAKQLYRQLLALHPTHVRARNNLALILDAEGNHQGALAELDRALDIETENGTLLVNRGALLGAMGRYAAAERDLKKVLRVEPAHAEALFNLGVVMSKKGLWAEAVPHLKRAVELEPNRAAAHYYLGEALNHVDDLVGALAAYQRATELQPSNPRALYGLGIIYDRLARPDDAAQMYRRSREVGRR